MIEQVSVDQVLRMKKRFEYFIPNYLIKLIGKNNMICSAGCGTGYDVEMLNSMGYNAYGFDAGQYDNWKQLDSYKLNKLKKACSYEFPFDKGYFDFVYALEVIEHIGTEDGIWKLVDNHFEIRSQFVENLLEMLKPNGTLMLTVSNRLCPYDVGHGHGYTLFTHALAKYLGLRVTIPWHKKNFLLSFDDIVKLIDKSSFSKKVKITLLSTKDYLAFAGVKKDSSLIKISKKIVAKYYQFASSNPVLGKSFLNPFLVVKIEKTN